MNELLLRELIGMFSDKELEILVRVAGELCERRGQEKEMREAAERSIAQVRENEKGAENLINESSRVIIECLNANTLNKIAAIRVKLSTELQQLHSKHNDENNCFRDTGSNQNGNRFVTKVVITLTLRCLTTCT